MTTTKHFSTQIARDPAAVYALLTDLSHYADWLPHSDTFKGMHSISNDPIQQGTTYRDGQGALEMRGTITKLVPDKGITFHQTARLKFLRLISSGIDITISYTLEPYTGGTNLQRDYTLAVSGIFKLIKPVVVSRTTVENERLLAVIKSHLEADS